MYKLLFYIIIVSVGLVVYIKKPKNLFIYWLVSKPLVLPVYFFFFPAKSGLGVSGGFFDLYFSLYTPISYLFFIIIILELKRNYKLNHAVIKLLFPTVLLSVFFVVQSVIKHFDVRAIINNINIVTFTVAPLFLLMISKRVRPEVHTLLKSIYFVVGVQIIFCFFNILGYSVYGNMNDTGSFERNFISGTFARYNHMTNYLTTIYLLISLWFFTKKVNIDKHRYYTLSGVFFLMMIVSGSRASLVLFIFIFVLCKALFSKYKFILISISLVVGGLFYSYLKSQSTVSISEADSGSGIERNLGGLATFVQSSYDDDDSTVALSFYLLLNEFNSPYLGNCYAYMGEVGYDRGDFANQQVFVADARFAYMLVEYGIIGFSLFIFLYYSIIRCLYDHDNSKMRIPYLIAFLYFLLNTITEGGFFDLGLFPMVYLYSFVSNKTDSKINVTMKLALLKHKN